MFVSAENESKIISEMKEIIKKPPVFDKWYDEITNEIEVSFKEYEDLIKEYKTKLKNSKEILEKTEEILSEKE